MAGETNSVRTTGRIKVSALTIYINNHNLHNVY